MTTKRRAALAIAVLLGACASEGAGRRGGLPAAQVAELPAHVQESYELFAFKCSRCHTLARPLSAAITNVSHWESYVDRMRHHAGSGISEADATKILIFLRFYAEQKARARAEESGEPPPPPAETPPEGGARP